MGERKAYYSFGATTFASAVEVRLRVEIRRKVRRESREGESFILTILS